MMHLATEISLLIFDHLSISLPEYKETSKCPPFPEELVTLARLCRCSRRLQSLAEPIIYQTIPYDSKNRRLLWRTLAERPDLRGLVRSMHLHNSNVSPDELAILIEAACQDFGISGNLVHQLLVDLRLGQGDDDRFEEDGSEDGSELSRNRYWYHTTRHVEIRFALFLLPKLELVELASYADLGPVLFDLFSDSSPSGDGTSRFTTHLECIRELRIYNNQPEDRLSLRPTGILALTALQSLRAKNVCWDISNINLEFPGAYINVRSIELIDAICNGPALADMLSRCPALRDLRIKWGLSYDEWEDELDFASIGDALRRHGQKLEVLELDCRGAFLYSEMPDEADLGKTGSLRGLDSLKKLTLPLDMLIGRQEDNIGNDTDTPNTRTCWLDELLPLGLERLHFFSCQDDEEQLDDQLFNIIAPGSKHMGGLCKIIMEERETNFGQQVSKFGWAVRKTDSKVILEKDEKVNVFELTLL